ncbi:MAG: DUF1848 domain-containing protein [Chloroflexi bacterium]|nr:DUF1848 domain-containing protein [Chloroflexota bacterium]
MRIISASRRTDIPAFYSKWLLGRLRAGFCHWRSPYGGQIHRVSLLPADCLAIVFWTRNPRPLLPTLKSLHEAGYRFYFQFTINGYPRAIETHNPPAEDAIHTFQRLTEVISPELVIWRYDPILLGLATSEAYHLERFDQLSRQLEGYARRCVFSFVDFYGKTERNLKGVEQELGAFQRPSANEQRSLAHQLRDIGLSRGITLYSCCEQALVGEGIEQAHCVDADMIAKLRPDLQLRLKSAPTRRDCGCFESTDIGAYDTCAFGCAYCYATSSRTLALDRLRSHDPADSILWRPPSLRDADLGKVHENVQLVEG